MKPAINTLAQLITKHSSLQTYLTVKLLVDKPLQTDCFKAYAYFRWIDDQVDLGHKSKIKRQTFIARQKHLIHDSYRLKPPVPICLEEQMLIELIATDTRKNSKLGSFIRNFFAIIEFDANRQHTLVSQAKLSWYTNTLAKAVTDGIEHFINHSYTYPDSDDHYAAAVGAHLTHLLRDYQEDIPEGYVNIPKEYLVTHRLRPTDTTTKAFQAWVKQLVNQAKYNFLRGKQYISALSVLRGKIAASWYCARFEYLLSEIEADGFVLRSHYLRRGNISSYVHMLQVAFKVTIFHLTSKFTRSFS